MNQEEIIKRAIQEVISDESVDKDIEDWKQLATCNECGADLSADDSVAVERIDYYYGKLDDWASDDTGAELLIDDAFPNDSGRFNATCASCSADIMDKISSARDYNGGRKPEPNYN